FAHLDDVARLVAHIAGKTEPEQQKVTVLNVAGWGDPLTYEQCLGTAALKRLFLPGRWSAQVALRRSWERGISAVHPETADYLHGAWVINIERLRKFLGQDFEKIIRFSTAAAFADSFSTAATAAARNLS